MLAHLANAGPEVANRLAEHYPIVPLFAFLGFIASLALSDRESRGENWGWGIFWGAVAGAVFASMIPR
jgi:hypothetical protein